MFLDEKIISKYKESIREAERLYDESWIISQLKDELGEIHTKEEKIEYLEDLSLVLDMMIKEEREKD